MDLIVILDCGQVFAEKYNRVHLLFFLDCWNKTTPVTWFKLSASTLKDIEKLGKTKIGAVTNFIQLISPQPVD